MLRKTPDLRLLYKTHLEPHAIPAIEGARMIIVGRPPADVAVSLWDYFTGIKPFGFAVHDEAAKRRGWNNGTFPRPSDYPSTGDFFRQWVKRRGFPVCRPGGDLPAGVELARP